VATLKGDQQALFTAQATYLGKASLDGRSAWVPILIPSARPRQCPKKISTSPSFTSDCMRSCYGERTRRCTSDFEFAAAGFLRNHTPIQPVID
jgi:hypothetical protein